MINETIDRMRHSATSNALARRDVVIVASVSAIYGLGAPESYGEHVLSFVVGEEAGRDEVHLSLVGMGYDRNDTEVRRGTFSVRGDTLYIWPSGEESPVRISFFDDEVERIETVDGLQKTTLRTHSSYHVYPATHYVADKASIEAACHSIEAELAARAIELETAGKLLERQRLIQRTERDLELLRETGRCPGVENYSRHFDGRNPGEPPYTLLDYLPEDLIVVLDESHVLIPQLSAQQAGDRSRKETLVEHGFRLPSACDNRPLAAGEFWERVLTCVMVSATPGPYERKHAEETVELIVRPTGIVDPVVEISPSTGAVADFLSRVERIVETGGRVLATVLTKKMAEDLVDYLVEHGIKSRYMHSDTETLERIQLLRDLRRGVFDVMIGINLLREGLDLPEVQLVAIFDADREGFLRSETSLIQTIGRAARNVEGRVVLYADKQTPAMCSAMAETDRRRSLQEAHNATHGIVPATIVKAIHDLPDIIEEQGPVGVEELPRAREAAIVEAESRMLEAAERLAFEDAAAWRDILTQLRASRGDTGA
jgi:excinuclease ABC subunit B